MDMKSFRQEFEDMCIDKSFCFKRNKLGEYTDKSTFYLWHGFFNCALKHNILTGENLTSVNK